MRKNALKTITAVAAALILTGLSIGLGVFMFIKEFTPDFQSVIDESCEKHGVDRFLVYAVIKAESDYDFRAVSRKGAIGLMQIMPATAAWLTGESVTPEELQDPLINIEIGVMFLERLNRKYTDFRHVLAAYNAGSGKVDEWIASGVDFDNLPFKETKNYLKKVKAFKNLYEFVL